MKTSEMTNDILANECESVAESMQKYGGKGCGAKLREAAARLRRPTPVDDDLLKMARDIDALRAKLKVAEDSLVKLQAIFIQTEYCYGRSICDNALAAIREEGGAK